jgi:hypothetical protein
MNLFPLSVKFDYSKTPKFSVNNRLCRAQCDMRQASQEGQQS